MSHTHIQHKGAGLAALIDLPYAKPAASTQPPALVVRKVVNMNFPTILLILAYIFLSLCVCSTHTATFDISNRCNYTVWAAAVPGGGQRLLSGQSWRVDVVPGTNGARIWGRTNCSFDGNGRGRCETGDCRGALECRGVYGNPPITLVEYSLNQINHLDFMDISIVDGFNIPMEFGPTTPVCRSLRCAAPINEECPEELRSPGGCNNPCTAFQLKQFCCSNGSESCRPTLYSRFLKDRCPDAYSYPLDDGNSTSTCPSGTNYRVVFCPPKPRQQFVLMCYA